MKEKTILGIDDDTMNLKILEMFFANYGINIDTATSAFEMLEKVKTKNYDLIITDEMMPETSGTE